MFVFLLISMFHFSIFVFFFLMIRRPPRSTLFPTRRSSDLTSGTHCTLRVFKRLKSSFACGISPTMCKSTAWRAIRSEEHTSELQSRRDLVCRLLLEKKNTSPTNNDH